MGIIYLFSGCILQCNAQFWFLRCCRVNEIVHSFLLSHPINATTDFPDVSDQYLHRVGRAGRFGTKGLAVSFISTPEDETELAKVQERFAVEVPEMPDHIDESTYSCM